MEITILYQDDDLVVINKPAGVVVNRADSVQVETIQDWAEQELRIKSQELGINTEGDFYKRSGIVHRLDKDTSGCLILAKNEPAFLALQKQFHDRLTQKTYVALVHGAVSPETGSINAPIGRLPWNKQRFGVYPGGREAQTDYRVDHIYKHEGEDYSLLSFFPKSGRTHQLRAHAKHINHTIVADPWYAGERTTRSDSVWCPRLFLHAAKIVFLHPITGEEIVVEAELPMDLKTVLAQLALK